MATVAVRHRVDNYEAWRVAYDEHGAVRKTHGCTGDRLIGLHDSQTWEDHRLSGTAKQALAILDGAGEPLEPGVIADRLIITSGSTTSLLDTLEKAGLVRRTRHPEDRRKVLVDIT